MHELDLSNLSLGSTLLIGVVIGFKHSLETDHLLAVSTLVARERDVWRSMMLGAVWGLGHTATLLVMGLLIIGLRWQVSESVATLLQCGVALMLMFLGTRTVWDWHRGQGHVCVHSHDHNGQAHAHAHFHRFGAHDCARDEECAQKCESVRPVAMSAGRRQSFWVGAVHGLAGSAAFMLLVLATIPHPLWALLYIALFGLGSVGGMCLVSALLSWSLQRAQHRCLALRRVLHGAIGLASLGFGIYLAAQVGAEVL